MENTLSKILEEPYGLSESQKAAVVSTSRYVKIIAGAGAGKTETLTRRILYLLIEKEVKPSAIVAFTFTEKAAQSMRSRIYQRIQRLKKDDLLRHFGEMYVGTIHGFFLRMLQDRFGYGDYSVLDENQEMAFVLRYGYTPLGLNFGKYGGIYSDKCRRFIETLGIVYGDLIDRDVLKREEYDFFHSMEKYERLLKQYHRLTFDYMSYLAVDKIRENEESISNISHLIVDEFQDINLAQYEVIEQIGKKASLFVVGDPRQSIYQWRGSNEAFFNKFTKTHKDAEEILINENRRSVEKIIAASNSIADSFDRMKYQAMKGVRPDKGSLRTIFFNNSTDEAKKVAEEILRAKGNGMNFSDFGILYRSVNTSAQPIIDELKKRRMPYIVGGKIGLFKRDEAQALGRIMVWLHEKGFWQTNQYSRRGSLMGDTLITTAIKHWASAVRFDIDEEEIRNKVITWKKSVLEGEYKDYKDILSNLLILLEYKKLDQEDSYDAAIMANIGRFSSLLGDFESANRYGGKNEKWNVNGELNSLCWYLNTYATKAYEEQASDDLSNVDAVNVMTIHQSKGLEWPTVFMPSMIKGRFPSSKGGKERDWLIDSSMVENPKRYYGGDEDEKRLFYVSVTRARDNLVISHFTKHNGGNKANSSQFLEILNSDASKGEDFHLAEHIPAVLENDEISTYSVKNIIDYRRCPFHYLLSTQWFYSQGISPYMGYGETMHSCLQRTSELIKEGGTSPSDAVKKAFEEKFNLPFAGPDFNDKAGKILEEQVTRFVENYKEDMTRIQEVESRVEFPLENATITGRVDVILTDGDYLEVRDYKTSDQVITKEDSALQVQLYALGLSHLGKRINKGSIAMVGDSILDDVGVTYTDLAVSEKMAKEFLDKISKRHFRGKSSDFCDKCEYNLICKWREK